MGAIFVDRCSAHKARTWLSILVVLASARFSDAQAKTDKFGDELPRGAIARLGTIRFRPDGFVGDLAFAPDGKTLASIDGHHIVIWEAPSGKPLRRLLLNQPTYDALSMALHHLAVRHVVFEPDGKGVRYMTASGSKRWRFGAETLTRESPPEGWAAIIPDCLYSPRGRYVLIDRTQTIELQDADGRKLPELPQRQPKKNEGPVFTLRGESIIGAFSADERKVALLGDGGIILVHDIDTKKQQKFAGHRGPCTALAFAPDGKTLLSAGAFIHEWEVATGKLMRRVEIGPQQVETKTRPQARRLAYSPDGSWFVVIADYKATRWDARTMKTVWTAPVRDSICSFSPDGQHLAVLAAPRKIQLLDAASGRLVDPATDSADTGTLTRIADAGRSVVFTSRGEDISRYISFDKVRRLRFDLWDVLRGERIRCEQIPLMDVVLLTYTADGHRAATLTAVRRGNTLATAVNVWDVLTGRRVRTIPLATLRVEEDEDPHAAYSGVRMMALADSGNRLAVVDSDKLSVWNLDRPDKGPAFSHNYGESLYYISSIAFSPDDSLLEVRRTSAVSISRRPPGTRVHFYDTKMGELLPLAENLGLAARADFSANCKWSVFSPNSRLLATNNLISQGGIQLWDLPASQALHELLKGIRVERVAFAPDSRSLATADERGRISLWECVTGGLRQEWQGHHGRIGALVFSPDGKQLFSQGPEGAVLVWDLVAVRAKPVGKRPSLEDLWEQLGHADAGRAHDAATFLLADKKEALALLGQRLKSPAPIGAEQIERWIGELGNNRFETRIHAMRRLAEYPEEAQDALKRARKKGLPLETQRRIDQLLEPAARPAQSRDRLRAGRAMELLEQLGCSESRALLVNLSNGNDEAYLRHLARESLQRMNARATRE